MTKLPIAKRSNLLVQQSDKEVLIYNTETDKIFCLNETAAIIWQNCNGTTTISQVKKMNPELNDDLIFLTLDLLNGKGLLDENHESHFQKEAIDRRKMFAKYGTIAIALPLITAIAAPRSIKAQSGCVDNGPLNLPNPGPINCSECPPVSPAIAAALACCIGSDPKFIGCDDRFCNYDCS